MAFVGADVEELRALAVEIGSGADELRDLGAQLAASIGAAESWQGPDARRCKDEWGELAQGRLADVAQALANAGRIVERNADEQEGISSADSAKAPAGFGWATVAREALKAAWDLKGAVDAVKDTLGLQRFFDALRHPARGFGALTRFEKVRDALEDLLALRATGIMGLLDRIALPLDIYNGFSEAFLGTEYEGWRDVAGRAFGLVGGVSTATVVGAALLGVTLSAPVATAAAVGMAAYGLWGAGNFVWDNRGKVAEAWQDRARVGELAARAWGDASGWVSDQGSRALESARSWARGFLDGLAPAPRPAGA